MFYNALNCNRMKQNIMFFLFLLLLIIKSFAQENPGARQIALSHADAATSNDAFALFNNPAGLAELCSHQVGLFYSPSLLGLTEISSGYGTYSYPSSIGTFSTGFMIFGFDLYKETKLAIGFGKKFYDNLSIGAAAFYKNLSIKNYGTRGYLLFNLGGIYKVSDKLKLGFSFENITRTTIGEEDNQFPVVFWTGLSYNLINDFTVFTALKKELGFNVSFRLGAEYVLLECLHLRVGTSNEPNIYSGGIGITYNIFQFDYAVFSHTDLGLTHQFGLITRF